VAGDRDQRTEKPTPRRLREARREGQVARSPDLLAWASVLVGTVLVQRTVASGGRLLGQLMTQAGEQMARPDPQAALRLFGQGVAGAALVVAPAVVGLMVLGVAGNLAQVGFTPSLKALKPKWTRLNPMAGLKRLASPMSAWEAVKTLLKLLVLGELARRAMVGVVPRLAQGGLDPRALAGVVATVAVGYVRTTALAGLALAAADYALQRRRLAVSLRMTKQEVKEEAKSAEGNPQVKGAIRSRQMQLSRQRMIAEVARADVLVVNPTHFAVALRYEPARGAPRVVAKGADAVAARIRQEAEQHQVPVVADAPLARTLYAACKLDEEIPAALYEAVARLLAFIFALKARGPILSAVHHLPASVLPD
jgi:flagellar biosynthetic protein FlhB